MLSLQRFIPVLTLCVLPVFSFVYSTSPLVVAQEPAETNEFVEIYAAADTSLFGRASSRIEVIKTPFNAFRDAKTFPVQETSETALLMQSHTVRLLERMAELHSEASSQSDMNDFSSMKVEKLDQDVFRISHMDLGFSATFRFEKPSAAFLEQIKSYYRNVYWQEEVEAAYRENYVITVLEAEDILKPYGRVDFLDAMISASLIAAKDQPLWGMHDGAGLLDGLGYMLVEQTNSRDQGSDSYRKFNSNSHAMEEIVMRLRQNRENLAEDIHTSVNSVVQYEEDDDFLLPEELLTVCEGDEIEFALTYYDLARRTGCEAKILALSEDPGMSAVEYLTVFQKEAFGKWGYIRHQDFKSPFADQWEDIPALLSRDNTFYFELNPALIMHKRQITLPAAPSWAISIY